MTRAALSDTDVMLAALLFALNGAISLVFGLRLEFSLAIAAVRMLVQLAAMGFVLKFVFLQSSVLWTAAVAIVMLLIAGYDLWQQQERLPTASATQPCCSPLAWPRSTLLPSSSLPAPGTRRVTCCRSSAWCSAAR